MGAANHALSEPQNGFNSSSFAASLGFCFVASHNPRPRKMEGDAEIMQISNLSILAMTMFPIVKTLWGGSAGKGRGTILTIISSPSTMWRNAPFLSQLHMCKWPWGWELQPHSVHFMGVSSTVWYFFFSYSINQSRTVIADYFTAGESCILRSYKIEPSDVAKNIAKNILRSLYDRHRKITTSNASVKYLIIRGLGWGNSLQVENSYYLKFANKLAGRKGPAPEFFDEANFHAKFRNIL